MYSIRSVQIAKLVFCALFIHVQAVHAEKPAAEEGDYFSKAFGEVEVDDASRFQMNVILGRALYLACCDSIPRSQCDEKCGHFRVKGDDEDLDLPQKGGKYEFPMPQVAEE